MDHSTERDAAWTINLGSGFCVFRAGHQVPPPPSESTAALLFLLARVGVNGVSRAELGLSLFPESVSARQAGALRQALHRLRRWLPELPISASRTMIRVDELMVIRPDLLRLSPQERPRLAMGLHHPVFAELRWVESPAPEAELPSVEDHFFEAIRLMALEDREVARQMLCGAASMTGLLSTGQLSALITWTRPRRKLDTMAVEHQELDAWLSYRMGCMAEAVSKQRLARKWAVERGDRVAESRTTAYLMFHLIEAGQIEEARAWLDELNRSDRAAENRLLILNARASLFWNGGDLERGLELMQAATPDAKLSSNWELAHYHANLAVLLSEMSRLEEAKGALETAERSIVGRHDIHSLACGFLVRMAIAAGDGDSIKLHEWRQRGIEHAEASTNEVARWYVNELFATLLVMLGDRVRSRQLWRATEAARKAGGGGLTPRLELRKAKIFGH